MPGQDFAIPPWVGDLSPWALVVGLIWLLARGTLTRPHTARVESDADKRIADAEKANGLILQAKDAAHAAVIAEKDRVLKDQKETIDHLRKVNRTLTEAVETIAEVQEQNLKTTDIVKAVMSGLQQQRPKDPTGPLQRVTP